MTQKEQQQMLDRTAKYGALMQHRFSAQPVFSKTGRGHLSATSTKDSTLLEELRQDSLRSQEKRTSDVR